MTRLLYAASAAALMATASAMPALAQSSTGGSSGTMGAPSIICQDLAALDRETARGVIYYMQGYQQALNSASGMQNQASGASGSTTGSGTSSAAADAGSTTGSATSGTTGTTGSADATGSTSTAGSSSGASGTSGSSGAMMAQLPGMQNVNVDQIMSTCQSSPTMSLSDVMMQGSGSAAQ